MPKDVNVQDKHVDQLTHLLTEVVGRLRDTPVRYGTYGSRRADYDPTKEDVRIFDVVHGLQRDEAERNPDGSLNLNIATLVIPALEHALCESGLTLYEGGYQRFERNMVSVGGAVSANDVDNIGVQGYDLQSHFSKLDEPRLRRAARESIRESLTASAQADLAGGFSAPVGEVDSGSQSPSGGLKLPTDPFFGHGGFNRN